MSEVHLARGSALPPLEDGAIRLFSMKFCPYAERSRLVLTAKGIKFNTVNCNLSEKPEWLLERNPNGAVPVFEQNGNVIYESLIVNDYLDEAFPEKTLSASSPLQRARDRILISEYDGKTLPAYYRYMRSKGADEEAKKKFCDGLARLEADLVKRGTDFFGGSEPGMLDYNIWPWFEKLECLGKLTSSDMMQLDIPALKAWMSRMLQDEIVKTLFLPTEIFVKFYSLYILGKDKAVYDFD